MTGTNWGRWRIAGLVGLLVVAAAAAPGLVRAQNPNERDVRPEPNVQDPDDIVDKEGKPRLESKVWVLNFRFKDPRLITVDVPGRGRRVCWYMWYQVLNYTGEPRAFIPDFQLVARDKNKVYRDEVLPKVQDAIRQVEDPNDYLKIKNSVTIAADTIPVSDPKGVQRPVTGVAVWCDVDPDASYYSVFVTGLSNGWSLTDPIPPDTEPVVRRKTLQLNFKRLGDRSFQDSRDLQFLPPAQWVYRATPMKAPASARAEGATKPESAGKPGEPKPELKPEPKPEPKLEPKPEPPPKDGSGLKSNNPRN